MVLGLRQGRVDRRHTLQSRPPGRAPSLDSCQIQHLPRLTDWLMPQTKRTVERSC